MDQDDLVKTGLNRRALFRVTRKIVEYALGGIGSSIIGNLITRHYEMENDNLFQLKCKLFDPRGDSGLVATVPGLNNPNDPPTKSYSKSGADISVSFLNGFKATGCKYEARSRVNARVIDGELLIGSHFSNIFAKDYFYDRRLPHAPCYVASDPRKTWRADLEWAFYTPREAERKILMHDGQARRSLTHKIARRASREKYAASYCADPGQTMDVQEFDYLLISVLPKSSIGRHRIVNIAGLHRPGTMAARLLFEHPEPKLLEEIVRLTHGQPWYQA